MKNQCIQPLIAKKLLNESVSRYKTNLTDKCKFQIEHSPENSYMLQEDNLNYNIYNISFPMLTPWFNDYRNTFFNVMLNGEQEYLRNFLACIFVVSSNSSNPITELEELINYQREHQGIMPGTLPHVSSNPDIASFKKTPTFNQHTGVGSSGGNYRWFCANVFHFHVLLHDSSEVEDAQAKSVYENMKNMYGNHSCYLLRLNSYNSDTFKERKKVPKDMPVMNGGTELQMKSLEEALLEDSHPLQQPSHPLSSTEISTKETKQESFVLTKEVKQKSFGDLNKDDVTNTSQSRELPAGPANFEAIKNLLSEFCLKGLLPWAERQMKLWNEQIQSKRGLHKSFISATKKWFAVGKSATSMVLPTASNASNTSSSTQIQPVSTSVLYNFDSLELQTRQLADLAFLFHCYQMAYNLYHSLKKDFQADQAWIYYAGALEMAGISSFMSGTPAAQYPSHYLDTSINTYLNVCNLPVFATRTALISTEILKAYGNYPEAAMHFLKLTSEESDLRSALFIEQAALCFVKIKNRLPMVRKYGFHMVLAGNKYFKIADDNLNTHYASSQLSPMSQAFRSHGLRCYTLARKVFGVTPTWNFAFDHMIYTLARHYWIKKPDNHHFAQNDQDQYFKSFHDAEKCLRLLFEMNWRYNTVDQSEKINFFSLHYPSIQQAASSTTTSNVAYNTPISNKSNVTIGSLTNTSTAYTEPDYKTHNAATQTKYFKELIALYNELQNISPGYNLDIAIPVIDCRNINVVLPDALLYNINKIRNFCDEPEINVQKASLNKLEKYCYETALNLTFENEIDQNVPGKLLKAPGDFRYFTPLYDISTNLYRNSSSPPNCEPSIIFANEIFRIDIPIMNNFKIPLILTDLHLLGHFTSENVAYVEQLSRLKTQNFEELLLHCGGEPGHNDDKAEGDSNRDSAPTFERAVLDKCAIRSTEFEQISKDVWRPYQQNREFDNIEKFINVDPLDDIFLAPYQSKIISVYVRPTKVGFMRVDGLKYKMIFPFSAGTSSLSSAGSFSEITSPSSNTNLSASTLKSIISFERLMWCGGIRLNDTMPHRKSVTFSIDKRLQFYIKSPLTFIKADLITTPPTTSTIYDGQFIEDMKLILNPLPYLNSAFYHLLLKPSAFSTTHQTNNDVFSGGGSTPFSDTFYDDNNDNSNNDMISDASRNKNISNLPHLYPPLNFVIATNNALAFLNDPIPDHPSSSQFGKTATEPVVVRDVAVLFNYSEKKPNNIKNYARNNKKEMAVKPDIKISSQTGVNNSGSPFVSLTYPMHLHNSALARKSPLQAQPCRNIFDFLDSDDEDLDNLLFDTTTNPSSNLMPVSVANEEEYLKADLMVFTYSRQDEHSKLITHDESHLLNHRVINIPIQLKSLPSLDVSTQYSISQSLLGIRKNDDSVIVFIDIRNLTKESDDKIMEITIKNVIFVSNAYNFANPIPSQLAHTDIKIKPTEHIRLGVIGQKMPSECHEGVETFYYSDLLSKVCVTDPAQIILSPSSSNKGNVNSNPTIANSATKDSKDNNFKISQKTMRANDRHLLTRTLGLRSRRFTTDSSKVKLPSPTSLHVYWEGLIIDETGGRSIIHGVHSCTNILSHRNVSHSRGLPPPSTIGSFLPSYDTTTTLRYFPLHSYATTQNFEPRLLRLLKQERKKHMGLCTLFWNRKPPPSDLISHPSPVNHIISLGNYPNLQTSFDLTRTFMYSIDSAPYLISTTSQLKHSPLTTTPIEESKKTQKWQVQQHSSRVFEVALTVRNLCYSTALYLNVTAFNNTENSSIVENDNTDDDDSPSSDRRARGRICENAAEEPSKNNIVSTTEEIQDDNNLGSTNILNNSGYELHKHRTTTTDYMWIGKTHFQGLTLTPNSSARLTLHGAVSVMSPNPYGTLTLRVKNIRVSIFATLPESISTTTPNLDSNNNEEGAASSQNFNKNGKILVFLGDVWVGEAPEFICSYPQSQFEFDISHKVEIHNSSTADLTNACFIQIE